MKKKEGLLIYGLDSGELSLDIGRNLEANPPENFIVKKYEDCLPSKKLHEGLIDGILESETSLKGRGMHETSMGKIKVGQWLNWGLIYEYFRKVDAWVSKQFNQQDAKVGISLHSQSYVDWDEEPPDFSFSPRYYDPRLVRRIDNCVNQLAKKYGKIDFDVFGKEKGPIGPYNLVLLFISHHSNQESEDVALPVRDFCNLLVK